MNPYVGPRAFLPGEQLYGRDREVLDLLDLLIAERIVLLYSPSGAGKTSLIQAALSPELQRKKFVVLPVIRVNHESGPLPAGANRYLLSTLQCLDESLPADQQRPPDDLAALSLAEYLDARKIGLDDGPRAILIFDQFEELLTLDPTDHEARLAFMTQVGLALQARRRWALFSLREDYVAGLDPYKQLLPTRLRTTMRLDLLGVEPARTAIREPARREKVEFTDAAARRLVDDLRRVRVQRPDGTTVDQPGPYIEPVQLQVVCRRLWERLFPVPGAELPAPGAELPVPSAEFPVPDAEPRNAQRATRNSSLITHHSSLIITTDDILALGDVDNALADYYTERVSTVAAACAVSERSIRQWFDRRLITPQGLRGQVLQEPGKSQGLANPAIAALIDTYLVREERRRGATWYELAHDRLIAPISKSNAAWREINMTAFERQASLWDSRARPPGLLLEGPGLAEAETWAEQHPDELSPLEREFLEESQRARVSASQAQSRRSRRLALGALVTSAITFTALLVALYFAAQARSAEHDAQASALQAHSAEATARSAEHDARNAEALSRQNEHVATSRAWAATALNTLDSDPELSLLLAAQAQAKHPTDEAEEALHRAVLASRVRTTLPGGPEAYGVAFTPDGRRLASAHADGNVRLWEVGPGATLTSPQPVLLALGSTVTGVAFSPDGRLLAAAAEDGTGKIWGAAGGEQCTFGDGTSIFGLAFSPDGQQIATGGAAGVTLWSAAACRQAQRFGADGGAIYAVAFSPDGRRVGGGGVDGITTLWNIADGSLNQALPDHSDVVRAIAFSPDGRTLATGGGDGAVRLWESTTGAPELPPLVQGTQAINSLAFSPDNRMLAVAGGDKTVQLWEMESRRLLFTLRGHSEGVTAIAFDPASARLASASLDLTVKLWSVAPQHELRVLPDTWEQRIVVKSIALSADSTLLAAASADQSVRLWETGSGQLRHNLTGHGGAVNSLAFSPDGSLLAGAGADTEVRLWEAASGDLVNTFVGHSAAVNAVAFSADGHLLASGSGDGTARIWDLGSGTLAYTLGEPGTLAVNAVAFSPDSRLLATGGDDGNVRIWSTETGKLLPKPLEHEQVTAVAFSPDGRMLASASADHTARVWSTTTGALLQALEGHTGPVIAVAFSPAGPKLITAGADGQVKVWVEEGQPGSTAPAFRNTLTLPLGASLLTAAAVDTGGRLIATAAIEGSLALTPFTLDGLRKLAHTRATRPLSPTECAQHLDLRECPPAPFK